MAEIISIINQKGGVGKSTVAQAMGQGLREIYKKKVLIIDLDAQCNLSYALGAEISKKNILNVLQGDCILIDAIQYLNTGNIVAGSPFMTLLNLKVPDLLKKKMENVKTNYDFIVIDTPPALSSITYNALTASDSIIIPAMPDIFSLQGINQLYSTIYSVKERDNKRLVVKGILLTKFNNRTTLNQNVAEQLMETAERYGTKLFKSKIREAVAVREAQVSAKSIFEYAPKSKVTEDFKQLLEEVIEDGK